MRVRRAEPAVRQRLLLPHRLPVGPGHDHIHTASEGSVCVDHWIQSLRTAHQVAESCCSLCIAMFIACLDTLQMLSICLSVSPQKKIKIMVKREGNNLFFALYAHIDNNVFII